MIIQCRLMYCTSSRNDYVHLARYLLELASRKDATSKESYRAFDHDVRLEYDDIDSLQNRRIHLAGEALGRHVEMVMTRVIRHTKGAIFNASVEDGIEHPIDPKDVFPSGMFAHKMRGHHDELCPDAGGG